MGLCKTKIHMMVMRVLDGPFLLSMTLKKGVLMQGDAQ